MSGDVVTRPLSMEVELQNYTRNGIKLWLNGAPARPSELLKEKRLCVREDSSLMRDYIFSEGGAPLREVRFETVRKSVRKKR